MYQLDEKVMADNRALLTVNASKPAIDRMLKNGMLNYVTNEHNDLYLTVPRSKDYGDYNRLIQEEADGKIPYDLTFKGNLVVEKNLTVLGESTTIDTPSLSIEDNIIEINRNETGEGITLGASGIQANRGTLGNVNWLFSENTDVPNTGAFVFDLNANVKAWIYENGDVKTLRNFDTQAITAHGDIYGESKLTVDGAALLKNTLGVTGPATLSSTLGVSGATNLLSSLTVAGSSWLKSTLRVDGAVTLNDTLTTVKAATLQSTLDVTGITTLKDNAVLQKRLDVTGAAALQNTLAVTGATTLASTLGVTGNTSLTTVTASGAATLQSTLAVTGDSTLAGKLTVQGDVQLNNNLVVAGTQGAYIQNGPLRVGGFLNVEQHVLVGKHLNVADTLFVGKETTLTGQATLNGGLVSTGQTTLVGQTQIVTGLGVEGPVVLNGPLTAAAGTFNGTVLLKDTLTVQKAASFVSTVNAQAALNVTGATTLSSTLHTVGDADFDANVNIDGNLTMTGTLTTSGDTQFNGAAHFLDTLTVDGATSLATTLDVVGKVTGGSGAFLGDVTGGGTLTIEGYTTLKDNLLVSKTIDVIGAITGRSTLTVNGNSLLKSDLQVTGVSTLKSLLVAEGGANITGVVNVTGALSLADTLTVAKQAYLQSSLNVTGATTLSGTLGVAGNTIVNGTFRGDGAVILRDTLNVQKAADFDMTVNVDGNLTGTSATFSGAVGLQHTLTVAGTSNLKGVTTLDSTLSVAGNTNLAGPTSVSNTLTVSGITVLREDTTLEKKLNVTGIATLSSALNVLGDTTLTKTAGLGGKLTVGGATILNDIVTVNAAATFNETATFKNNVTILDRNLTLTKNATTGLGGQLNVGNAAQFDSTVNVTGNLTGTTASFSGAVTLNDTLTVEKISSFKDNVTLNKALLVTGTSSFTGSSTFTENVSVGGTLTVTGVTTLKSDLIAQQAATMNTTLNVKGAADFDTTINVDGAATFQGAAAVKGLATLNQLTVDTNSLFKGSAQFNTNVTVTGTSTLNGTLNVAGATVLGGTVIANGATWLKSGLTVDGGVTLNNITTVNGSLTTTSDLLIGNADSQINRRAGGPSLTASTDPHLHFNIDGVVGRNFVFSHNETPILQITPNEIYSAKDIFVKDGSGWTQLVRANQLGTGQGLDSDKVDGLHANLAKDGTTNELAVYDANKRVYDSDRIDGYHAAVTSTSNTVAVRDAIGNLRTGTALNMTSLMLKNTVNGLEVRNSSDTDWADLTIRNLTIKGTTTTIASEQVTIADNIILLNSNVTGAAEEEGGIHVERGTSGEDASLIWNEGTMEWWAGLEGSEKAIAYTDHTHTPASIGAVKNGNGVPEVRSGLEADRPAFGMLGRLYFSTDTKRIWQDMSTSWQMIGGQDTIDWTKITNKPTSYTPPIASATTLGGIKVGANLSITSDGTLNAGSDIQSFIIKREEFVTTEGQTTFTLTKGVYPMNTRSVSIFLQGSGKIPDSAVIEVSPTQVQLKQALAAGSYIEIEYLNIISLVPYPIHANEHLPGGADAIPLATLSSAGLFKPYTHTQTTAATTWTIDHNMNRYPSVITVGDDSFQVIPQSVKYASNNQIIITFSTAMTGRAFLN